MFLRPANDISCKHDIACWAFATKKRTAHMNDSQEAQTRFELVIRVLQTRALPLGYVAIYNILYHYCHIYATFFRYNAPCSKNTYHNNDSYGNRTRVTAVKGRCLNRLTKEPYKAVCFLTALVVYQMYFYLSRVFYIYFYIIFIVIIFILS